MRIRSISSWISCGICVYAAMVRDELIVKNEIMNDGGEMHLYFSKMYEEYLAYGYSAFAIVQNCKLGGTLPEEEYSEDEQMPMVKVNQEQLSSIKSKGIIVKEIIEEGYLHIQSHIPFDERKYSEWAQMLRG